jgi:hypothetical protein
MALPRRRRRVRRPLDDELETLEEVRREHRPEDDGRRCEIVDGDPAAEPERERGQERSVGTDPVDDRLRIETSRCGGLGEDDTECLALAELDEDRLPELEIGELLGDRIRVRPRAGAAGGIDRDLDTAGRRRTRRRVELEPERHRAELRSGRAGGDGGRAPRR